jgi:hypothetical protein
MRSLQSHLNYATVAATLALVLAMSGGALAVTVPAEASPHAVIYRGKLGRHGRIRIDVLGSRSRVYFDASCKGEGREPQVEEVGTYPPSPATDPSFEPFGGAGSVHAGRVSIDEEEFGESHDESSGAPTAHVKLRALVTPHRVKGVFSVDVSGGASLFPSGPAPEPVEHCKSGNVAFTATRSPR